MSRKTLHSRDPAPQRPYECLYYLKIHLLHISPQIYRRLLLKGDTTIVQLHHIVQLVMGWNNYHLHYFRIHGRNYGIDYTHGDQFLGIPQITRLGDFDLRINDTFHYVYDYYDQWVHQIRVENITTNADTYLHPICLAGKRACPPEESGGPAVYERRIVEQRRWAYEWLADLVERLEAGENPMEDNVPKWYFTHNPEKFARKLINQKLNKLYQIKGSSEFWLSHGGYEDFFRDLKRE